MSVDVEVKSVASRSTVKEVEMDFSRQGRRNRDLTGR